MLEEIFANGAEKLVEPFLLSENRNRLARRRAGARKRARKVASAMPVKYFNTIKIVTPEEEKC